MMFINYVAKWSVFSLPAAFFFHKMLTLFSLAGSGGRLFVGLFLFSLSSWTSALFMCHQTSCS